MNIKVTFILLLFSLLYSSGLYSSGAIMPTNGPEKDTLKTDYSANSLLVNSINQSVEKDWENHSYLNKSNNGTTITPFVLLSQNEITLIDGDCKEVTVKSSGFIDILYNAANPPSFIQSIKIETKDDSKIDTVIYTIQICVGKNILPKKIDGVLDFSLISNSSITTRLNISQVANRMNIAVITNDKQKAPDSTLLVPWTGNFASGITYYLVYNTRYEIIDPKIDGIDWIDLGNTILNQGSGLSGTGSITIKVKQNSLPLNRFYILKVKYGEDLRNITYLKISQPCEKSEYLNITPSELNFDFKGGTQVLKVKSDMDWDIISYPNWVGLAETKGSNNREFSVVVNSFNEKRENQDIIFEAKKTNGEIIRRTVKISQFNLRSNFTSSHNFNIYPSVNDGSFTIETNNISGFKFRVFSTNGSEVYRSGAIISDTDTFKTEINIGPITPGVYYILAETNGEIISKKIIVK